MLKNVIFLLTLHTLVISESFFDFTIKTLWNSVPMNENHFVQIFLTSYNNTNNLIVEIDAPFYNDTAPEASPGPFDKLWEYEVVELFLLSSTTKHYIELEFSPHGHYLVLLLTDERQVLKTMLTLPWFYTNITENGRWYGQALIPQAHLPANIDRFNAYAIHGKDEQRTYQALYPAPSNSTKPDFHRLELFQPINFELLISITDKDGESWNTGKAIHDAQSMSTSLLCLFTISSFFLN